jgi:hypothetical protein
LIMVIRKGSSGRYSDKAADGSLMVFILFVASCLAALMAGEFVVASWILKELDLDMEGYLDDFGFGSVVVYDSILWPSDSGGGLVVVACMMGFGVVRVLLTCCLRIPRES